MAKIIHIDDERQVTQIVKDILESEGHEVTSFNNLSAGLRHLYTVEEKPEIVIFDGTINKPFDGRNEAERMQFRFDDSGNGPKVILLSGDHEYTSTNKGFENLRKIGKPVSLNDLINAVNDVLAI